MSGNEIAIVVTGKNSSGPAIGAATKEVVGLTKAAKASGDALDQAGKKAEGFGHSVKRGAEVAGGVLAADALKEGARVAVDQIKDVIGQASDLNESVNAVQKIFHENSGAIQQWGEQNATSFGLSTAAFNKYATPLGAALKNQGLDLNQTSEYTIRLTKRAADMASVFNTDVGSALEAIQAGLRGEADPLEKFGVGLSAAKVQARALADSGKTSAAALTQQELALARLNILFDQTADSEGDFASTSTGAANAQRIMTAEIDNAKAKIGTAFLPILGESAHVVGVLVDNLTKVPTPLLAVAAAVGIVGAGFIILAPRIKSVKEAFDDMRNSDNKAVSALGNTVSAATKVAAVFGALQVAGTLLGTQVFETDLVPNIEATADSLEKVAHGAKVSGEAARIFGDDSKDLDGALAYSSAHGFSAALNKFDEISSSLIGMGGWVDESNDKVKAFDAALAQLVQTGSGWDAQVLLQQTAERTGISIDELRKILPQYEAAVQLAGSATAKSGGAAAAAALDYNALSKEMKGVLDDSFSLEESQDKQAEQLEKLGEAVKKQKEAHGKLGTSLQGQTDDARNLRAMMRDLIETTEQVAIANSEAGLPVDDLKKKLRDQLTSMGLSADQIQPYLDKLDQLIAKLNAVPRDVSTNIVVHDSGGQGRNAHATGGPMGAGDQHAAEGGPRGGWTTMNEYGPERVNLPYGSMVYSKADTERMGASTSGGGVHRVELGSDGSRLGDALIWLIEEAMRGKGGDPSLLGLVIRNR